MSRKKVVAGCQLGVACHDAQAVPRSLLEDHHVIPKEWQESHPEPGCKIKGGRGETILVCRNCHKLIHDEMRKEFGRPIHDASEEQVYAYADKLRARLRY